jgi:hypothetical protein
MKRITVLLLALMLAAPMISRAQSIDQDQQNPNQYRDVDDGQVLKLVSYVLTPFGMALEWGLMRPLHHLATQTSAAPLLSGDNNQPSFFDQNDNASHVPPGTFGPSTINPTNQMYPSNNEASLAPVPAPHATLGPAESIPPSTPLPSGNQPALH